METFKTSLISYLKDGGEGSNRDVMNKVGNKVFQAIIAYSEQMFDEAARLLLPVSENVYLCHNKHEWKYKLIHVNPESITCIRQPVSTR